MTWIAKLLTRRTRKDISIYRLVGCQIADGAFQVGRMTDLSRDVTVALPQDDPS